MKKVFYRDGETPIIADASVPTNLDPLFYIDTVKRKVDGKRVTKNLIRMIRSGTISIAEEIDGSSNPELNNEIITKYIMESKFGLY